MVFTLSEVQDAADVQILIRGQLKDLPRGDRSLTASPLTIFDFPGSRASTQPDLPPVPSPTLPASTVAVATTTT